MTDQPSGLWLLDDQVVYSPKPGAIPAEDKEAQDRLWELKSPGLLECPYRATLITTNMKYVHRVVAKMRWSLPPHVNVDDLQSYGYAGLIRAVDNFDPTNGARFSSYAVAAIRGTLLDELRSLDWAPRSLRRRAREITKVREDLTSDLGREPSPEEVAAASGESMASIRQTELEVKHSTFRSTEEVLIEPQALGSTEQTVTLAMACQSLVGWLREQPQESQMIMALYYYEGLTLAEISRELQTPQTVVSAEHRRMVTAIGEMLKASLGRNEDGG